MKKSTKVTAKSPVNHHNLVTAYDLVITDLFHSLKKLKDGESIKLGQLGTFQKKQTEITAAFNGKTYVYYRISFKVSSTLKKELDK